MVRTRFAAWGIVALGLSLAAIPAGPTVADRAMQSQLHLPLVYVLAESPHRVRVDAACCRFNAPGNDLYDLNGEYVCFENYGSERVDLSGWRVRDETSKTYTFSEHQLVSKASVRLHTGSGTDTLFDVYWGRSNPVWNNDGDTVYLYDALGRLVDRYSYDRADEYP